MSCTRYLLLAVAAMCMSNAANAQIDLINPTTNNGSFEFAGGVLNVDKIQEWDTTPDIDNWTTWSEVSTADTDSGVQDTGNATDGQMIAFLQGNNAVYNLTDHLAVEGDLFTFSWDHVLREDREHRVGLVYDDGGVITSIADSEIFSTGILDNISGNFTIPTGHAAIGNQIGLGVFANGTVGGGYPEVDNFVLSVGGQAPVEGDVDGDRDVDLDDYAIIRDNFRLSPATKGEGDLVGADIVDLEDFLYWRSFNPTPTQPILGGLNAPVPEPSAGLLSLFGLLLAGRRSRR